MSYADIQSRIADELSRDDLGDQIKLEIKSAIDHYDPNRTWFNETTTSFSCSSSVAFVSVPADMVVEDAPFQITVSSQLYNLVKIPYETYQGYQVSTPSFGQPVNYSYYADKFYLWPTPNSNYLINFPYIKILTTLSAGSDTNGWLTYFEEMIRSRANQAVRIRYLHEPGAMQESMAFAMRGDDVLSGLEYSARQKFYRFRDQRVTIGKLKAHGYSG